MNNKLVLVGNPEKIHIGAHFLQSGQELGLQIRLCDTREAFQGSKFIAKLNWHLREHRPRHLGRFGKEVIRACRDFCPRCILAVGIAPVESRALREIGKLGIRRLNYLTDDPWNPAHRARWFTKALGMYDYIFSPRRSNMDELKAVGCRNVSYLPFAYVPELHFSQLAASAGEEAMLDCEVLFIGGADRDRIPYITAIIKAGFKMRLYGGYWERFRETKAYAAGHIDSETFRKVITRTKVALCLVRKSNRDGHSMRSFEIPAVGACMLTEDTEEHRQIFGKERENTLYFKTAEEMTKKLRFLLADEGERKRLANNIKNLILNGRHTYKDRLLSMLKEIEP